MQQVYCAIKQCACSYVLFVFFFFQAEDGIRDVAVTGVQTCALPISQSQWARAYYELQVRRGKKHHAAVRALAFKWIRIIYRCWKERVAYDENVYLAALAKHNRSKSTRLNSSHGYISYAVFCLKKKKT